MEERKGSKGFAIVALIMGILAIVNSFIPIINFIAYVFAILGIIFGIIGIVKKNGKGMAITGLVLAGISLILATVINTTGFFSLLDEAVNEAGTGSSYSNITNTYTNTYTNTTSKNKKYGLGDKITFDGLEITFDSTYSFTNIENRFSDLNGRSVIKLGVNVKNVSSEKNHLNMFYYDLFGSQGIELDGVTAYFDDSIDYAGDLKPDASYRTYFYILYDGDGKYSIDFDNYSQELTVEFNVVK